MDQRSKRADLLWGQVPLVRLYQLKSLTQRVPARCKCHVWLFAWMDVPVLLLEVPLQWDSHQPVLMPRKTATQ